MKYDYTVIGGGVSGMTTALIMAKQGFRVALIEKSAQLAPTVRGFTKKGLYFDTGFHYAGALGKGQALGIMFRYLGLADGIGKVPLDKDGFDTFRCLETGFHFEHPYGYGRIREKFYQVFPNEKAAVDKYFLAVKELYSALPFVDLDCTSEPKLNALYDVSLQDFLDGLTNNGLLKCILSMHCFLHGVGPDEIPFANHSYVAGSYYESASTIAGGGLSLAKVFAARLKEAGVDLYCGEEVKKLLLSGNGLLSGVVLENGLVLSSANCISTMHPRNLLDIVPDACFRPAYASRLRALEETVSAFIVYAACSEAIDNLKRTNLFIFPKPDFSFLRKNLAVEEQPLYIAGAGEQGESAKHGFIAVCPMSEVQTKQWAGFFSEGRSARYRALKEEMAGKIVRSVETSCPEIAGKITDVECATPLTLRDYANSPFGSLYGVKHRMGQYNPIPVTRLKGLFLAGQAITAPGVMGAMMSGFLVCDMILGQNTLQKELKKCRPEG